MYTFTFCIFCSHLWKGNWGENQLLILCALKYANSDCFVHEQPTEAPTVEKSSAAKDPTDPPSQPEDNTGATDLPFEEYKKDDDLKLPGEFIAIVLEQDCR